MEGDSRGKLNISEGDIIGRCEKSSYKYV